MPSPPQPHDRSQGKFLSLNPQLYHYILSARSPHPDDALLLQLREETLALGDAARMQISPEQGSFLRLLVSLTCAENILEIGTFTGYSSICLARPLPDHGRLVCLDVNPEWTTMARRYWQQADLEHRIELHLGPARESLDALAAAGRVFDLVFVDADKTGYDAYYEAVLPLLRPNGLILFDNMLWGGRLVLESMDDENGQALARLNRKLASDPRVESVLLPIADGLHLCRKR